MARFALEYLKARKATFLTDTKQDYSVGLSGFFKDSFVGGAGTVVRGQTYSTGDTDFRAQLTSVKAAGPDVIFLPGYYPEVGIILKQGRQLGITAPFIGCEAWDSPTLLQVAGKAADGCYYSNQFSADDPSPVVQEFGKIYREKFGSPPDNFAALGYDAARVVLDAIKRANSTNSTAIRDAIAQRGARSASFLPLFCSRFCPKGFGLWRIRNLFHRPIKDSWRTGSSFTRSFWSS